MQARFAALPELPAIGHEPEAAPVRRPRRIQAVLRTINDRFVHANLDYYHRHLNVGPGDPGYMNVVLSYFEDDTLQLVNVLAFLHLLLVVQEALLALFNKLFGTEVALPSSLTLTRTAGMISPILTKHLCWMICSKHKKPGSLNGFRAEIPTCHR